MAVAFTVRNGDDVVLVCGWCWWDLAVGWENRVTLADEDLLEGGEARFAYSQC